MRYLFQAILCFQLSYDANILNTTSTCIGKMQKKKTKTLKPQLKQKFKH